MTKSKRDRERKSDKMKKMNNHEAVKKKEK